MPMFLKIIKDQVDGLSGGSLRKKLYDLILQYIRL